MTDATHRPHPINGRIVTAIVQEFASPLPPVCPDVLLYTVAVANPLDGDEVLMRAAEQRADDLDTIEVEAIRAGLRLVLVLDGEPQIVTDHR